MGFRQSELLPRAADCLWLEPTPHMYSTSYPSLIGNFRPHEYNTYIKSKTYASRLIIKPTRSTDSNSSVPI